jgi:hypothetical protein
METLVIWFFEPFPNLRIHPARRRRGIIRTAFPLGGIPSARKERKLLKQLLQDASSCRPTAASHPMTYRFISPSPSGSVIDIALETDDLQAAFDDFAENHWRPEMTGTFAVWCGQRLAARILPLRNAGTGDVAPMYQEFDPSPRSTANRFACGD